MTSPGTEDDYSAVCPYLGLTDDADSHATYATEAHRCYRLDNPTRIASGHQETYCLQANHVSCPVFRGEGIAAAAAPAAAATASAASRPASAPSRPASAAQAPRSAGVQSSPFGGGTRRAPSPGALGPRPRGGGISMPVATIGLFAAAIIVIALAFVIQRAASDGGDDDLPVVSTNESPSPAGSQTTVAVNPGGTQTAGADGTPAANGTGTPAATSGAGGGTYVVKSGDFCGSIASANNVSLEDLLSVNDMTEADCTSLQVGQELKLP